MAKTNVFTPGENVLLGSLGVYGCWLLKHGACLPVDAKEVQALREAYQRCYADPSAHLEAAIMDAIDDLCAELPWEKPRGNFDKALAEITKLRKGEKHASS
jgi:hypothetical protein